MIQVCMSPKQLKPIKIHEILMILIEIVSGQQVPRQRSRFLPRTTTGKHCLWRLASLASTAEQFGDSGVNWQDPSRRVFILPRTSNRRRSSPEMRAEADLEARMILKSEHKPCQVNTFPTPLPSRDMDIVKRCELSSLNYSRS